MADLAASLKGPRGMLLGLALAWPGWVSPARAQEVDANLGSAEGWQRYDWLAPSPADAGSGGKLTASSGLAPAGDPFAVVSQGAVWQENLTVDYTRALAPGVALSYETSAVTLSEDSASSSLGGGTPDDLSHTQKASLQFQPVAQVTLGGNVHDSTDDAASLGSAWDTRGTGFNAEGHLPGNSDLTLSLNNDTTTVGESASDATNTSDDSYDAQWKQPLGKLPFTAVLKGHYEETSSDGETLTRLPSLEQSLIWKPGENTTLQMGLRQQHYQNFPGVTNELNEAVFADWAQTIVPEVTWHSYAEVLNTRGTQDVAPAAAATSGANGTPQSSDPADTMATSFSDETLTFSTGPSFKLDRDVSADIEYSDRVDRNPAPGDAGQEQRVSVSLKGTF